MTDSGTRGGDTGDTARDKPSASEVRAALDRILASRCFQQAGRASDFLRFVVEQTLEGSGQRLKGYTIGVEVFGRPADFDAQSDALVRVEAGRLRRAGRWGWLSEPAWAAYKSPKRRPTVL